MKGQRIALTQRRIADAACPADRGQVRLWDATQPGLLVRVYPTGAKTYWCRWRAGGQVRWDRVGDVDAISLKDARKAAGAKLGEVAGGGDPAAKRRAERRRERRRLEPALEAYEASLEDRGVVKRSEYLSLLRRELLAPWGNIGLDGVTLEKVLGRIKTVRKSRPGAAKDLRTRAAVFLSWCAGEGLVPVSPMAGYRQPRRTRAQKLAEERAAAEARALDDTEIPAFWRIAGEQGYPFGPYLKTLLLTGQRRTETAKLRWADLDFEAEVWRIPAGDTKSGRAHDVPLPPELIDMLAALPRRNRCPYVFPGRDGAVLSGWSKRIRPVCTSWKEEDLAPFTLHDLRRTMRTGLTKLGVDQAVAEMMLNHAIGDELRRIYDKYGYPEARVEAAKAWARHVFALVEKPAPDNVVPIKRQPRR